MNSNYFSVLSEGKTKTKKERKKIGSIKRKRIEKHQKKQGNMMNVLRDVVSKYKNVNVLEEEHLIDSKVVEMVSETIEKNINKIKNHIMACFNNQRYSLSCNNSEEEESKVEIYSKSDSEIVMNINIAKLGNFIDNCTNLNSNSYYRKRSAQKTSLTTKNILHERFGDTVKCEYIYIHAYHDIDVPSWYKISARICYDEKKILNYSGSNEFITALKKTREKKDLLEIINNNTVLKYDNYIDNLHNFITLSYIYKVVYEVLFGTEDINIDNFIEHEYHIVLPNILCYQNSTENKVLMSELSKNSENSITNTCYDDQFYKIDENYRSKISELLSLTGLDLLVQRTFFSECQLCVSFTPKSITPDDTPLAKKILSITKEEIEKICNNLNEFIDKFKLSIFDLIKDSKQKFCDEFIKFTKICISDSRTYNKFAIILLDYLNILSNVESELTSIPGFNVDFDSMIKEKLISGISISDKENILINNLLDVEGFNFKLKTDHNDDLVLNVYPPNDLMIQPSKRK